MDPGPPRIDHGLGGGWDLFLVAAPLPFLGTASVVSRTLTFRSGSVGNLGLRSRLGSCRLPGVGFLVRRPPGLVRGGATRRSVGSGRYQSILDARTYGLEKQHRRQWTKRQCVFDGRPYLRGQDELLCVETSWLKNPATTLVPGVVMSVMSFAS